MSTIANDVYSSLGLGGTPGGLRKIADDFAAAAEDPDPAISRLAASLQTALREAARSAA